MTSRHDTAVADGLGRRAWRPSLAGPGLARAEAVACGESVILGAGRGDLGGIRHYRARCLVLTGAAVTRRRGAATAIARGPEVRGEMLNLKIMIGSTRPGRAADQVIPWITGAAREHGDFAVDVLDLRDWPLPLFGETLASVGAPRNPTFSVAAVKRWNEKIAEGDAYLFVTPEYNHSIPAVLKNAIDSVFATFAFRGKPAAFVAYSGGIGGGVRAIEHLALVAIEAEMVPLRNSVIIPFVGNAFGPGRRPGDPRTSAAAKILLDELAWWANALRQARAAGTLPPAAFRLTTAKEGAEK